MTRGVGKRGRRAAIRAIIELEGGVVKRIENNRGHLKIYCSFGDKEVFLVTSENEQGRDSKWPMKFKADVRRAFATLP